MKISETKKILKARLHESRKSLAIINERYNSEIDRVSAIANEYSFECERMKVEWLKMKNALEKAEKDLEEVRRKNAELRSELNKSKNMIVCRHCETILGKVQEEDEDEEYED